MGWKPARAETPDVALAARFTTARPRRRVAHIIVGDVRKGGLVS
jgi:hypothetical protein